MTLGGGVGVGCWVRDHLPPPRECPGYVYSLSCIFDCTLTFDTGTCGHRPLPGGLPLGRSAGSGDTRIEGRLLGTSKSGAFLQQEIK